MTTARVLVAGVGNIFLGDDGFGVEVVTFMAARPSPDGVRVADFGIRGVHLAYELLDGYDLVVLVDTIALGQKPGTVTVLESDLDTEGGVLPDGHDLDPAVMGLLTDLGVSVGRMLVVGCEPADLGEQMGLSAPVAAAVDDAIGVVEELVREHLHVRREGAPRIIRRLVVSMFFAALAGVIVKSLPDVARYLRMREM